MFTWFVYLKSIPSSLVKSLHTYTSKMNWVKKFSHVNALKIILPKQSNTVISKRNLKIQWGLDVHSFQSINLRPWGDSSVINLKTQAVWPIKCNFNSWIGARPRAEHRQMDTQGCWALASAGQHI